MFETESVAVAIGIETVAVLKTVVAVVVAVAVTRVVVVRAELSVVAAIRANPRREMWRPTNCWANRATESNNTHHYCDCDEY